jgi:protease-4
VSVEVYKTTPRADAESMFRPYSADERRELRRKVRQFYDTFLSRVALGRKLTKKQVDAVGQGRVWTGEPAHERRLVDAIGGLRQAVEYARRAAGLPDYAPIVQLPPPQRTLLGQLVGVEGMQVQQPTQALPPQLLDLTKALAPFVVHDSGQPLALMEFSQTGF